MKHKAKTITGSHLFSSALLEKCSKSSTRANVYKADWLGGGGLQQLQQKITPGLGEASQTDEISAVCWEKAAEVMGGLGLYAAACSLSLPPQRSFLVFFSVCADSRLGGPAWRQSFLPFPSPPVSCSCLMGSNWQPMTRSAVSSADEVLQRVLGSRRRPSRTEYQDTFHYQPRKKLDCYRLCGLKCSLMLCFAN